MRIDSMRDLVVAARSRRRELGLSQEELAARMVVSRQWVSAFENGHPRAEFGFVMRLLYTLDLRMELRTCEDERDPPARGSVDLDTLLSDYRDA